MNDAQHAKSLKCKYGKKIAALRKQRDELDDQISKLTSKYQSKCRHSKTIVEFETNAAYYGSFHYKSTRCTLCGIKIMEFGR